MAATSSSVFASPMKLKDTEITTPRLVYGTAWKKERSAELVHLALKAGLRAWILLLSLDSMCRFLVYSFFLSFFFKLFFFFFCLNSEIRLGFLFDGLELS